MISKKYIFAVLIAALVLTSGCVQQETPPETNQTDNVISGETGDTLPNREGEITVQGVGKFGFNAADIQITLRDDIFTGGHFSVFDVLVYIDKVGFIDLEYHFDKEMNTHVIDSINGIKNWWYMVYYDGGWPENNVFRMDHYPYKDNMYIRILQNEKSTIDRIHNLFRDEMKRKENNGGKVIIPEVIIRGPTVNLRFENVGVTPHDLRDDVFSGGTVTAIDAILSLADQGKLTYDLQWYESIGSAGIVKNYWVERINEDEAHGRCGFVYEAGSKEYAGFKGNHIHLPSDSRVIHSPEYEEFFWICL